MRTQALAATPAVVAFVGSARLRERPHGAYAALRRVDPVHRSPFGFWVVTGHAAASAVLRDPAFGSDEGAHDAGHLRIGPLRRLLNRAGPSERGAFVTLAPQLMLFRDPPDHTRLRRLVSRAFTPRRVGVVEESIRALTEELLDGLAGRRRFDVMDELAYPSRPG